MKRIVPWIGVLLVVWPLRAEPPAPKLVEETWDAVTIEGARAGYFCTTVREVERDGKKLLACTQAMQIGVKREGKIITVRAETGDEETPGGRVVGVSFTDGALTQTGRVEGDRLVVKTSTGQETTAPWDDSVMGMAAQERLFGEKKVKPGDQFSFLGYEPSLQVTTLMRVTVKDPEEVDVLEANADDPTAEPRHVKKTLLRADLVPDKVKIGGRPLQLPAMTEWLDKDYQVVRSETDMPGLGRMVAYRTTRGVAEQAAAVALLPDLLLKNLIPLDRAIDHPEKAREVVYRVTLKGDDDPAAAFAQDARQEATNVHGDTFDLRVRAVREPKAEAAGDKPGSEFLDGTYFLDSGSAKVKALAAEAVGDETDPWRKAQRIEKWVHEHMKVSTGVDYVPASRTAEDLVGDCRQHAMLTAALCRAAKIPSRTALGLVYDKDPEKGPVLAFHMWTEVWVKGQWLGIDAVWGEGGVGADHLKIADHSWADTQTLAPLAAVTRVMGKVKIEVVEVK